MNRKEKENYLKDNRGITLVALVVTIIVLIILAGVSINLILGDNGIITKAQEAKKASEKVEIITQLQLKILEKQMEEEVLTDVMIAEILSQYGTVQYEEDGKTVKGVITEKGYEIAIEEIMSKVQIGEMAVANGTYSKEKNVNTPQLLTGMTPIKYEYPTDDAMGKEIETTILDKSWYEYGITYETKRWANAVTKDSNGEVSGYWVWIPRFAYKINSSEQTTDVVFLIGKTDKYYDENGNIQIAQRCTSENQYVETDSTKTDKYTVHPAFTNESSINYRNGGWDSELSGIWVAKFEAGYASGNNNVEVKSSGINYSQSTGISISGSVVTARNWLDGIYGENETTIKYPVFLGTTYSMNYIDYNDTYNIAKALTANGNIYGLSSSNTDSHLMKNSELGAVTYLSRSKYGLYTTDITINNATIDSVGTGEDEKTVASVYALTGCTSNSTYTGENVTSITTINTVSGNTPNDKGIYTWNQKTGQSASTTGTIYGIYDLSGGTWEKNASLISNGNVLLLDYGKSLLDEANIQYTIDGNSKTVIANTGASTKYVTIYPNNELGVTDFNIASTQNYSANALIYGDSIRETSTEGIDNTSWYNDCSMYPVMHFPFIVSGGGWWHAQTAGLSCYHRNEGFSIYYHGFRAVLVSL